MRLKAESDGGPLLARITLDTAFVVFGSIPLFILSAEVYDRHGGHLVARITGYALVVVMILATAATARRSALANWNRGYFWLSFGILAVSVAAVTNLNLAAGGAYGTYHVLFLLPVVLCGVMGDVQMIAVVIALALAGLGIDTWSAGRHSIATLGWTLADNLAVWIGAAASVHLTVTFLLSTMRSARAAGQLASAANDVERWPSDFEPCMPLIALALRASSVTIAIGPAGSAPLPVLAFPDPTAVDPDRFGAAYGEAVHRALDANEITEIGTTLLIPRRTVEGMIVVVVAEVPRSRWRLSHPTAIATVIGQLVSGVLDRVSLVGSLQLEVITDPLTGLSNRRGMQLNLDRMMNHAHRTGEPLSMVVIDLDHFKDFNDSYGHLDGDDALRTFAEELVAGIRAQDLASRHGGEEFCLLLPITDAEGARRLVEGLRRHLGITGRGREHPERPVRAFADSGLTFSAGVAQWDGVEDAAALFTRADMAMYRAKATGRDLVEVAT